MNIMLIAALKSLASQKKDILNLQADTVLTVYHGTSVQDAYEMVTNGIDAKKAHPRKYPHHSGGKKITRGIYVTPELKVAREFGHVILKFKVLGKNLWPMFPTLMKEDNEALKDEYPNSFRPAVTNDMLTRRQENQALFIGAVSPRSIEKVYVYEYESNNFKDMTRDQFITENKDKIKNHTQYVVEPQETNISLDELIERVAKENRYSVEKIQKTLDHYLNRESTKEGKRNALFEIFEPFAPYSILKKLARRI